ncbi:putative cyclin-D6-1 [Salvia splendens]|uniref:putative cyclin-D6-1 n=1 Tax=Salvia splendens TaxID=180675 RepID=UPI001C27AC74|nr:putative cyclin-D6-1 [Salvia splendens]
MEFDLENPLPFSTDIFPSLFNTEIHHMPSKTLLSSHNLPIRREIASAILHISRESDPFLSYLAVNYMDRFLSAHSIPNGKPWIFRLVAVSCVSLALKMRQTELSVSDLADNDGDLIFNSATIERMEMLILGALKWRMRSVNPFSFLNYFVSLFDSGDDERSIQALKNRGAQIIFKSQNDIKLLEFKPSIVSASALLVASHEFSPMQFQPFREAICSCSYVIKEELLHCYDVMAAAAGLLTPANVQDFSCSFSEIESSQIENSAINESPQLSQNNQ